MQSSKFNRQASSGYAPAKYGRQQYQRHFTADAITDDPSTQPSRSTPLTTLASKDNFDRIANIAREAYDATRVIMGELNVEDKIFQIVPTAVVFDFANGLSPQLLNQVPQNVNEAGRTGDSIKMKGLYLTLRIVSSGTIPVNTSHMWKALLVYHPGGYVIDKNFPTTASDLTGLLEFSWMNSNLAPLAPRDYDSMDKAHVIWEKEGILTPESPMEFQQHYIKLHRKVQFENDSSVINTGALCLYMVSDKSNVTYQLAAAYATRLYFVDN